MPLFRTLSTCGWLQEGRNGHLPSLRLTIPGDICKINGLFTLPSYLLSYLCSIKESGVQTWRRRLFWDISLPSSRSASFPNKVVFLVSTLCIRLTGLSCSEHSELRLSNMYTGHSSCHTVSTCQDENMSFSNSNKNTSGLMVALTLPETEEPPSLHPSPDMPTRLGCWVYSAGLDFIAPLPLLTDPLQSHASWAQVSCPLDTTCPQLPSPARCWPLNLRAATSAVSLSHAYSSCRTRLNHWASLRKAFLAHLWLRWTRCVCLTSHTPHLSLSQPQHSTLQTLPVSICRGVSRMRLWASWWSGLWTPDPHSSLFPQAAVNKLSTCPKLHTPISRITEKPGAQRILALHPYDTPVRGLYDY